MSNVIFLSYQTRIANGYISIILIEIYFFSFCKMINVKANCVLFTSTKLQMTIKTKRLMITVKVFYFVGQKFRCLKTTDIFVGT